MIAEKRDVPSAVTLHWIRCRLSSLLCPSEEQDHPETIQSLSVQLIFSLRKATSTNSHHMSRIHFLCTPVRL